MLSSLHYLKEGDQPPSRETSFQLLESSILFLPSLSKTRGHNKKSKQRLCRKMKASLHISALSLAARSETKPALLLWMHLNHSLCSYPHYEVIIGYVGGFGIGPSSCVLFIYKSYFFSQTKLCSLRGKLFIYSFTRKGKK